MNTLLLHPTDLLFFRDGRPMSGSLSGHGAAWPLPSVLNSALHAALHRAELTGVHTHRRGSRGVYSELPEMRDRKFGGLVTAGPFPVHADGRWLFPRPGDAQKPHSSAVTLQPVELFGRSSLPGLLTYSIANTQPPTKLRSEPWWDRETWQAYLQGENHPNAAGHWDSDFSDTEHSIGIGIDPETGTQDGKQFYSAHYLRLREGWSLGLLAEAIDKIDQSSGQTRDLVQTLFPNSGTKTPIIVGGQQRLCTVQRTDQVPLPLPMGAAISGNRVKWILLSPAIWPKIGTHPGGWLPSWVDTEGNVQLLDGPGKNYAKRHKVPEGTRIPARLVAALVPKPIPVNGYALPNPADPNRGGHKSTHLAVPAGAVYYFEASGRDAAERQRNAEKLATALNWHGPTTTTVANRRSTIMGEKGFGLGVCGNWEPLRSADVPGRPQT